VLLCNVIQSDYIDRIHRVREQPATEVFHWREVFTSKQELYNIILNMNKIRRRKLFILTSHFIYINEFFSKQCTTV